MFLHEKNKHDNDQIPATRVSLCLQTKIVDRPMQSYFVIGISIVLIHRHRDVKELFMISQIWKTEKNLSLKKLEWKVPRIICDLRKMRVFIVQEHPPIEIKLFS
ncbi:14799_t:CDS:1 [Acaulospora morrowiae]|uniref:14799_t:CDS:1 n=1 Tax=Acaulospora morrowiae TaxID=94023 RepID=A0A9N8ZJY9_9GLOM|nr:14799_t:CDS:1 [Acaulospora morrowiae]